jgi:thioredoxin reductase
VGAITVGLGDISSRPDIPIISESQETTIPGIYIAGELSGIGLIRHAIDQGARAVADIARKLAEQKRSAGEGVVDVLVVGSGPAGISATLKAMEQKLSYTTIDQDELGGTVRKYPRRKLTLTQTVEIPLYGRMPGKEYHKEDLLELWEGIIKKFNVSIQRPIKLLGIQNKGEYFEAETSTGPIRSRAVVLALGRRGTPRKLGVPGEEQEKVLYQLIDAATYNGQNLLVVGGGDSAIEAAVALASQEGNTVTISYRKHDFFRLKAKNEQRIRDHIEKKRIRVLFSSDVKEVAEKHVILSILGDEKGKGEATEGEESGEKLVRLDNDYVFVLAGGEPPFPLLKQIGIGFGGSESRPESREGGKSPEKSPEKSSRKSGGKSSEKSSAKSPEKEACLA